MKIVMEQNKAFLDYANEILHVRFDPAQSITIASVTEDNQIMGVVVYTRFTPFGCELSVASTTPKFLTRSFLRVVFGYPFKQCGMVRISAVIEDGNINAIDMDERLGFIREATLKQWYGDTDGILLRMTKDECKWI